MKNWHDCTRKERVERWEQCLRVLQSLSPHERRKHWDMSNWGFKTDCGTVACAAGHCGLDPWFRRRGFILEPAQLPHGYLCGGGFFRGDIEVDEFFGWDGTYSIFWNTKARPVSSVIREVKQHIKELKART